MPERSKHDRPTFQRNLFPRNLSKWQKRIDLTVGTGREFLQRFGQPAHGIDTVEFGGSDQALNGSGSPSGALRAGTDPVIFPMVIAHMAFSTALLLIG